MANTNYYRLQMEVITSPEDLRWKVIKRWVFYPSLLINALELTTFREEEYGGGEKGENPCGALK